MNLAASSARIALSRRTIDGWDAGGVGGRAEDTLRMIRQEVARLASIGAKHPELASEAAELGARYGALANRIRMGLD